MPLIERIMQNLQMGNPIYIADSSGESIVISGQAELNYYLNPDIGDGSIICHGGAIYDYYYTCDLEVFSYSICYKFNVGDLVLDKCLRKYRITSFSSINGNNVYKTVDSSNRQKTFNEEQIYPLSYKQVLIENKIGDIPKTCSSSFNINRTSQASQMLDFIRQEQQTANNNHTSVDFCYKFNVGELVLDECLRKYKIISFTSINGNNVYKTIDSSNRQKTFKEEQIYPLSYKQILLENKIGDDIPKLCENSVQEIDRTSKASQMLDFIRQEQQTANNNHTSVDFCYKFNVGELVLDKCLRKYKITSFTSINGNNIYRTVDINNNVKTFKEEYIYPMSYKQVLLENKIGEGVPELCVNSTVSIDRTSKASQMIDFIREERQKIIDKCFGDNQ